MAFFYILRVQKVRQKFTDGLCALLDVVVKIIDNGEEVNFSAVMHNQLRYLSEERKSEHLKYWSTKVENENKGSGHMIILISILFMAYIKMDNQNH